MFGIHNNLICSPKTVLQEEKSVWSDEANFKELELLAQVKLFGKKPLVETSKFLLCKHHLKLVACWEPMGTHPGSQMHVPLSIEERVSLIETWLVLWEAEGKPHRGS